MAQPYRPPTKVVTTQTTLLALVVAVDPDWESKKHREIEYLLSNGRVSKAVPYKRGQYAIPEKTTMVNYAGPLTLNAGDITGVGFDFVVMISDNASPGVLTMRTAAQMFADIAGAVPGMGYALRVVNFGGTSALTLVPGDPATLMTNGSWTGQPLVNDSINPGNFTDYQVQFPDATDARIMRVSGNQP